ncbi:transporter substrate-binding domain-containing protein [Pelomonas sp. P8]|uniref:Transporter substrate-binding domain-containing protein n=2 Tax=Pelomonas cellulosilytica TaxID=2906762 RepID=A0ABS8Y2C4_9BURK|nr:transporter substrate-binding domain-containing protein [Pelomonas sp. P8]
MLALGLWAAGVTLAAPMCPEPLRIGFADHATPPGLLGQGPEFADPPGWEVLAVRDAARRLGCEPELQRLPSRRLLASLAQGSVDFALLYGVTPERLAALRFPLDAHGQPDVAWAPFFGRLALFGRAGTLPEPGWDGHRLSPHWRVGVIAGSVHEAVARERGWQVEALPAASASVAMLQAGRFDLLLAPRESLPAEERVELVEWSPLVGRQPYFMPASPAMAKRHPAWTRAFWNEFCEAVRRRRPDVRPTECGVVPPAVIR